MFFKHAYSQNLENTTQKLVCSVSMHSQKNAQTQTNGVKCTVIGPMLLIGTIYVESDTVISVKNLHP